jgi:hypothetical protein
MSNLVPPLHEARVFDWIRHHIVRQLQWPVEGLEAELAAAVRAAQAPEFRALRRVQETPDFTRLRENRLRIGHLRYETCGRRPNPPGCVQSIVARWEEYGKTRNLEHLVDIANLAELEWICPSPRCYVTPWLQGMHQIFVQERWLLRALARYEATGNLFSLVVVADIATHTFQTAVPEQHWAPSDEGHWSLR